MTKFTYSIEIARPLAQVYRLASQVERHPEMMPEYLSCCVLERQQERLLLERTAMIRGKILAWRSWASFRENEGIYFVHEGGPLNGMHVNWRFKSLGTDQTQMSITQEFHIRHPLPYVGAFLEQWIFGPKLRDIAERVIHSFKQASEASIRVAA